MSLERMTHQEWLARGRELFGEDYKAWRFQCPVCGNVAAVADFQQYEAAGATPDSATCECIGRYQPDSSQAFGAGKGKRKKPCDYAGYGLFRLSPVRVDIEGKESHSFAFASRESEEISHETKGYST